MIRIDQYWIFGVTPPFGVEMQAENQIRMQFRVNERRPATNLAVAIKQNLALPVDGFLFFRVFRVEDIVTRPRYSILDQNFSGQRCEITRTHRRDWLRTLPDKGNAGAQLAQSRSEYTGHAQSQITFPYRQAVTNLEPALFHLRPFAAEVPGI